MQALCWVDQSTVNRHEWTGSMNKLWSCIGFWLSITQTERFLSPAGGDVAKDPPRAAVLGEVAGAEHGQRAVDVALHGVCGVVPVRSHGEGPVVHQPRDHVRCEGDDHGLQGDAVRTTRVWINLQCKRRLTFVTTARMATPCRMGCHAPMSWAFSGTTRRNWVVIFHASTRISNRLLTRAKTGARGKEATNRVTKPNWMTAEERKRRLFGL